MMLRRRRKRVCTCQRETCARTLTSPGSGTVDAPVYVCAYPRGRRTVGEAHVPPAGVRTTQESRAFRRGNKLGPRVQRYQLQHCEATGWHDKANEKDSTGGFLSLPSSDGSL
ncbi:hypothetical protein AAHC03_010100 [Spirometra sp. Aus1]